MKSFVLFSVFYLLSLPLQAQEAPDSSKVYVLGEILIPGVKAGSSAANKINAVQLREFNKDNVTEALNLLPGISITEAGARNEGQIYLRGFNLLQTPVFYDGIPIYVPYDGNIDLSRFTTFDLSQITVSKALTSVLYGPNTMGGAINIVSRKPVKPYEVWGMSGLKISDHGFGGYNTSVSAGSKKDRFYVLGSISFLKNNFLSLSGKFVPATNEDGAKRENSDTKDLKISAKVGYTPNATDEYSLNFIWQNAEKGIPPVIEGNQFRRYPEYDKRSLYYRSKSRLNEEIIMDITAFYDNYYNIMSQYDDNTYTVQNRGNAFNSVYDDYALGVSANWAVTYIKDNLLKLSMYEKYDSHKEHNKAIPANPATGQNEKSGEPVQKYTDNTVSIGLEDVYTINDYLKGIAGINYSYRKNKRAQEYGTHYLTGEKDVLYDFPTGADKALNYQLALIVKPADNHEISFSASRKSRFASQKDRYSSRFGSALPNPDLKSEFSWIFDLTYHGEIKSVILYEVSLYRNNIDNAIYQVTIPGEYQADGVTPLYQNRNTGKSFTTGYELSLSAKPLRGINIGAVYAYIHYENKKDKDLKFVDVPAHKGIVYGKFNLPAYPESYLHLDMETYSKRYYTSDGKTLPAYTLLNLKFSSKVWKGFNVEAGVKNLLDKDYSLSFNYPKEGRTYFTSLLYDF
jgi:iron complex outermembrane receptor protein